MNPNQARRAGRRAAALWGRAGRSSAGAAAIACVVVSACSTPAEETSQPFSEVADMPTLMSTVVEPAADAYWDAVGWIYDAQGETEIRPRTDEEWIAVRNAAFQLAEAGNLLMIGERALDSPAWIPMARSLVDVGRTAIHAAESRDPIQVFNAGAEVYYVCSNCHAQFALETLPPADERHDPGGE